MDPQTEVPQKNVYELLLEAQVHVRNMARKSGPGYSRVTGHEDVPVGLLRVIEHYFEQRDTDGAANVLGDILGGRGDRWMDEAWAVDAIAHGRLFQCIRRFRVVRGNRVGVVRELYLPTGGRLLGARSTCVDHEGEDIWVCPYMHIDEDAECPDDSDPECDGVWCCWIE